MREIPVSRITDAVERLCIEANTHLPDDVKRAIEACRACEDGDIAVLAGAAGFNGALHVIGEVGIGFDTQPLHGIGDPADRNFSHMFSFFPLMAGIMGKLCRRKSLPVTSLRPL